jgi:ABC-type transport system involved in multi-copper enzyme maturation permease subunit
MILLTLARNAFLESIRQPIHTVIICGALLALVLNVNLAGFTLDDDNKLLVDLGLSTLFLAGLLLAAFTATGVLSREIENKTVITVVSKPVPRPLIVFGKFLGVTGSIAIAYWLLAGVFLLTVRHRVQTSVRDEDIFDVPVVTFGLLAAAAAFGLASLANYLYRSSFPATFAVLGASAVTVAVGLVACVNRFWELQDPRTDFNGQLMIGLVMVFEGIVVLTAIAIAASTRLGQIPTLTLCFGIFLVGLVGEFFVSLAAARGEWIRQAGAVIPNLQFFWPADAITQGSEITVGYLGLVSVYAACMVGAVMALAVLLFQTRDVG